MKAELGNPIFVALDVDSDVEALRVASESKSFVGGYKVGPRLCMRYGEAFTKKLATIGQVFVDNKYFDIPSTMEAAVRASFSAGASFVTIHAQAGSESLKRLAQVELELQDQRPFRLLSVTVLTSFQQSTLPPNSSAKPISHQVLELAELSLNCGISGLVCSPEEVASLREKFPESYLVTPGIRLSTDDKGDQKRVAGPKQALQLGASALVVGRPICEAKDVQHAAKKFYEEIKDLKAFSTAR